MSPPAETGKPAAAAPSQAAPPGPRPGRNRWLGLAVPVILIPLLVALSSFWHVPTHVRLDLSASRMAFLPEGPCNGPEACEILENSVTFSSLTLERCGIVTFSAGTRLEIADTDRLVPAARAGEVPKFPPEAWQPLPTTGPVRFSCSDPAAKLTLQAPGRSGTTMGILDHLPLSPGHLAIVEVSGEKEASVSLEIDGTQKLNLVGVGPEVELVADFAQLEGLPAPSANPQTYRAHLPASQRTVEIEEGSRGLTLLLTPSEGTPTQVFRDQLNLPISRLDLRAEDLRGEPESALSDKATLTYPDYPTLPADTVERSEILDLGQLTKARLLGLKITTVEEKKVLQATFDGIVERAAGQVGAFPRDHRLTLYHRFRYSTRWGWVAASAVWAFSATFAAFEIWKKLHEESAKKKDAPAAD